MWESSSRATPPRATRSLRPWPWFCERKDSERTLKISHFFSFRSSLSFFKTRIFLSSFSLQDFNKMHPARHHALALASASLRRASGAGASTSSSSGSNCAAFVADAAGSGGLDRNQSFLSGFLARGFASRRPKVAVLLKEVRERDREKSMLVPCFVSIPSRGSSRATGVDAPIWWSSPSKPRTCFSFLFTSCRCIAPAMDVRKRLLPVFVLMQQR